MNIFEIVIETLFSAAEPCGGVGCVIYGLFEDDAAPDYDVELAAHLPDRAGGFGTLAVAIEALAALRADIRRGDHIDVALPTSMATISVDTLGSGDGAVMLEQFTEAVAELRHLGVSVRVTGHDRANADSLARATALADLAIDASALAGFNSRER